MLKFSTAYLSPQALRLRAIELMLLASPLAGAFYYGYTNQPTPLFCPIKALTGIPCPGCGMTRSFIAIATGHFDRALSYHFLGIFLFIGFAIAIVHLFLELLNRRKIATPLSKLVNNKKFLILLSLVVSSYYLTRIYALLKTGELAFSFVNSPLGSLFN